MTKTITPEQAFQRLASICARGEHCQHDLMEKMRRWGMDEEEQDTVMQRLIKGRYVDDERFCRAFVADKVKYNKWGRRKVEQALWLKHIDTELATQVLDDIDDETYVAVLAPLLRQKRRSTRADSDYALRTKLVRWALSRGFTMDIIKQCIDLGDHEDEFLDEDL